VSTSGHPRSAQYAEIRARWSSRLTVRAELSFDRRTVLGEDRRTDDATLPELESRLRDTQQRIARLIAALAAGSDDLPSVRGALAQLERDRERMERELVEAAKRATAGTDARDEVVAALLESLSNVREVLATGAPEERKGIVRTFLQSILVDGAKRQAVLRWFRVPSELSVKLVAVGGIEPPTRGL
jgi:septal ring factor EnvC (AmiA/AmiB activator)